MKFVYPSYMSAFLRACSFVHISHKMTASGADFDVRAEPVHARRPLRVPAWKSRFCMYLPTWFQGRYLWDQFRWNCVRGQLSRVAQNTHLLTRSVAENHAHNAIPQFRYYCPMPIAFLYACWAVRTVTVYICFASKRRMFHGLSLFDPAKTASMQLIILCLSPFLVCQNVLNGFCIFVQLSAKNLAN